MTTIFSDVTPYSMEDGYQHFKYLCPSIFKVWNRGSRFLQDLYTCLSTNTTSHLEYCYLLTQCYENLGTQLFYFHKLS